MTPTWWRDSVVYQVYPRSFADASGDGVGDLAGLTARLDHIAGLGADAIWLTPFQRSPQTDHGYDVSDYTDVDPLFGDLAGFDALVLRAHGLGLRVIVDIVPNHCSAQHPIFQAALAGDPSARARFHFAASPPGRPGDPPNDWPSVFGGPAWTRVPDGSWYLHLYSAEQPDWNWRDPRTAGFFDDVLRFWLDRGVDGLRVDVAHGLFKAAGLPSLPPGAIPSPGRLRGNPLACDQPETVEVYRRWRAITDSYAPPRALIGEVNLDPHRAARYVGDDRLHQAFAFEFLIAEWNATVWRDTATRLLRHPPVTWVVENHDVVRTATRYAVGPDEPRPSQAGTSRAGTSRAGTSRARAALLTILGLPGAAYLYQGQEYSLPEADVPVAARQDPAWPRSGLSRDGCRVPLPWPDGFSPPGAAPPWLPLPPGWDAHLSSPTLPLARRAITLRRALRLPSEDTVTWSIDHDQRLIAHRPDFALVVAMGTDAVPLPPGHVLLTSDPLTPDGLLPADTAAWITPAA
ncbi:alpha-amylase family glycosyl hydrolase [Actinoplanes sp. NEAU-A12]|uniref:Alpha-amylase family glycosyl hydrolase n=1 Tax=Actinoplanes sandaracinus TaxID=3045177 RepID=A0ABT6WM01_9ACTN|nr:alpha-amylase family glycosyl hydrolase [Actinoplanes sandaracinus]MDI6100754.1 alpha-amylase family glycosyl hydrolase [Actinoplanes sandaracinus]